MPRSFLSASTGSASTEPASTARRVIASAALTAVAVLALTATAVAATAAARRSHPPTAAQQAAARMRLLVPNAFHAVGPDVSSYQHAGALDWKRVRKNRGFAIIKATEGVGYVNPYFAGDWAAAGRDHLPRGAYHFASPAWPVTTADDQARAFAATVGPMRAPGDLPPVLDLEISGGLTPGQLVLWSQEWLREVRALTGRTPMLYTYRYFWAAQMGDTDGLAADGIPLWIADYDGGSAPHLIGGWPSWTMWQYTSSGVQAGISGRVDLSRFHGGAAAMRAFAAGVSAPLVVAPPAAPLASASTDSGQLVVSWVPRADGWSAPTGWTVRIPETGQVLTVGGATASATVPDAPIGVPLTAVVTARNSVGASAPSAPSAPVVLRVPTSLTPLTGAQQVRVGRRVTVRFRFAAPGTPVSGRQIRFVGVPTLGGAAESLGSAVTGSDGTVTLAVVPHQGIGLMAAFDGTQSQQASHSVAVPVRVVPTVSLRAPDTAVRGPVRVTGWTDAPAGTPVVVEVATNNGWAIVGRTRAASNGFAVLAVRPAGRTRWRAVVVETVGSLRVQSGTVTTVVTSPPPPPPRPARPPSQPSGATPAASPTRRPSTSSTATPAGSTRHR